MDDELDNKFRMQIGDVETEADESSTATERDGDATLTSSPLTSASSSFIGLPLATTHGCRNQQPVTVLLECSADCDQSEYGPSHVREGSTCTSMNSNLSSMAMPIHASSVPSATQKLSISTIGSLPASHSATNLTVNSGNGNRLISACSSHSNSTTSLESFVVVHTELMHPSLAFDELEEQLAIEQNGTAPDASRRSPSNGALTNTKPATTSNTLPSETVVERSDISTSRRAPRSESADSESRSSSALSVTTNHSDRPDSEMNRMLLAAYTKLTETASSTRQAKMRSTSVDGDGPLTSSSSSIDSASGTVRKGDNEHSDAHQQPHDARSATAEAGGDVNIPRVSVVRTPQRGATRRSLPESDLDSLDELESHTSTLTNLNDVRRTAHAHYRHRPNQRVDSALNELILVAVVLVLGMLIGRFGSTVSSQSSVSEAFERSASSHLEQLKAMHDELVTCLKRSGQLELTLHDTRSTMVQREYVEKWEALYDEARERNDALEQSYETYKRRYLFAAATQRSLRRALNDARLQLARTQLRYVYLAERLRVSGSQELSEISICTQPISQQTSSTSFSVDLANQSSTDVLVDSTSQSANQSAVPNPADLLQLELPIPADENLRTLEQVTTSTVDPQATYDQLVQSTEQLTAHEATSSCDDTMISMMEQVHTVTLESGCVVKGGQSEEGSVASANHALQDQLVDCNRNGEWEVCTIPLTDQVQPLAHEENIIPAQRLVLAEADGREHEQTKINLETTTSTSQQAHMPNFEAKVNAEGQSSVARQSNRPGKATGADQPEVAAKEPFHFRMSQHREAQRLRNQIQDEQQPSWYLLRKRRAAQYETLNVQGQYDPAEARRSAHNTDFGSGEQSDEELLTNTQFEYDTEFESHRSADDDDDDDDDDDKGKWKQRHEKKKKKQHKHTKAIARKLALQPDTTRDAKNRANSWIPKCKHCRLPRPPGAESTRKSKRKHLSVKSATW